MWSFRQPLILGLCGSHAAPLPKISVRSIQHKISSFAQVQIPAGWPADPTQGIHTWKEKRSWENSTLTCPLFLLDSQRIYGCWPPGNKNEEPIFGSPSMRWWSCLVSCRTVQGGGGDSALYKVPETMWKTGRGHWQGFVHHTTSRSQAARPQLPGREGESWEHRAHQVYFTP